MRIPGPGKLPILGLAVCGAGLLALSLLSIPLAQMQPSPASAQAAPPAGEPPAKKAWGLDAIRAAKAWETTRGKGETLIAVIDSGVLEKHEQLKARIGSSRSVFSRTGRQVDVRGLDHGTGVAVIASGGTLGVCPGCSVLPVQVPEGPRGGGLWADEQGTEAVIDGIYHAIQAGATVVNISMAPDPKVFAGKALHRALRVPFRAAEQAGVTVVVGAGNDGADARVNPFCTNPYTLCVGGAGLDSAGRVVPYKDSNHGPGVNVSAPAVEVYTGTAGSTQAYTRSTGTSFAAPHVAGLAGLIVSANPGLHPRDVRHAIIASAAGDKAVQKSLGWAVDQEALDEELKRWARAYLLLRGRTEAPDRVEERLGQVLLSVIPAAYAERWYYPEVVVPEGGNTIQGKAVGGLVDAPRAIARATKLSVPVARPPLDEGQAKLAASIPTQDLVRLYELLRLEGSYAGSLEPEGLAEIVGPFELRIAKPYDRLEVVRGKSPGKGYSEWLELVAPGRFRHLASFEGRDRGQGPVEVRRFGDFLFVKNPKTGARIAYEDKTRNRFSKGVTGGMGALLRVFDPHPRSVRRYSPAPFCTIAGCEAGVVKVGVFGEYEDRSHLLPADVSVFSGKNTVAAGSGSGPGFSFVLPPGAYRLRVVDVLGPGERQELDVTLTGGEEVLREVTFPKGLLRIRTFDTAGKPVKADVDIHAGKKPITHSWNDTEFGFWLSPGAYTTRVRDREWRDTVRTDLDVTIETGKALSRDVRLAKGTLLLRTFAAGGKPLVTNAEVFQGDTRLASKSRNVVLRLGLTPGTYRIRVLESGARLAGADAVVTIEDGKTTARDLTVPAGALSIRTVDQDGKPVRADLRVYSGDKRLAADSRKTAFEMLLPPGRYRLELNDSSNAKRKEGLEVTLEESKTLVREVVFGR